MRVTFNKVSVLRIIGLVGVCGLVMTFQACLVDEELTIVRGTVNDKITGEGLQGVPVEIFKCSHGGFLGIYAPDVCDVLKTVHTYANGDYEASFLTERGDDYTIGIGYNELCEETGTAWSGQIIKPGVTNVFDFQQAPFKVLEVLIKVDKNSKNYLGIFYQSNDTVYSWSGGTIFSDTSSMNQVIDTAIYLKLLPLGAYWFSKTVCSRSGQPYDYIYTDCEYVNSYLTTEYVDTITVN